MLITHRCRKAGRAYWQVGVVDLKTAAVGKDAEARERSSRLRGFLNRRKLDQRLSCKDAYEYANTAQYSI